MMEINPEKLKNELTSHGLNHNDVSENIGHNRNYLTDAFRRKRISRAAANALAYLYNIEAAGYIADAYKPEPDKNTEPKSNAATPETVRQEVPEIDYERIEKIIRRNSLTERELYKVIFQAVFKAVDKAWKQ